MKQDHPLRVVIHQSTYFPWVGMLEQVRLAHVFVHGDDVQLSGRARGFYKRVQIKTPQGPRWMTVPIRDHHESQLINEVLVDDRQDWRSAHRKALQRAYREAPYFNDMLNLVDRVFSLPATTLSDVTRASLMALVDYFGLRDGRRFPDATSLNVSGRSNQRVLGIVQALGGAIYITGHGARNYLDHELFERNGIAVEYMKYQCLPYPQLHGAYTPFVSGLDLVANCGCQGKIQIVSGTEPWREFMAANAGEIPLSAAAGETR